MRFILIIIFSTLSLLNLFCESSGNKHIFLSPGYSFPIFGHFSDFKSAAGVKFGYIKDIDDVLSFGFISSSYQYYKNKDMDIKLRIFSFNPVLFSWVGISTRNYFLYLGPGLYHISQPSSSIFSSSSTDEAGFRIGGGYVKNLSGKISVGSTIEFNHLFNMKTKNFDLGSVNLLSLSITVMY